MKRMKLFIIASTTVFSLMFSQGVLFAKDEVEDKTGDLIKTNSEKYFSNHGFVILGIFLFIRLLHPPFQEQIED